MKIPTNLPTAGRLSLMGALNKIIFSTLTSSTPSLPTGRQVLSK